MTYREACNIAGQEMGWTQKEISDSENYADQQALAVIGTTKFMESQIPLVRNVK